VEDCVLIGVALDEAEEEIAVGVSVSVDTSPEEVEEGINVDDPVLVDRKPEEADEATSVDDPILVEVISDEVTSVQKIEVDMLGWAEPLWDKELSTAHVLEEELPRSVEEAGKENIAGVEELEE
jgi:hypothetical protein